MGMQVSAESILLTKVGTTGLQVLRAVLESGGVADRSRPDEGLVRRFLRLYPDLAQGWLLGWAEDREPLGEQRFAAVAGVSARDLADATGLPPEQVMLLVEKVLHQGVQMAAPGGIRANERDAIRVDARIEQLCRAAC